MASCTLSSARSRCDGPRSRVRCDTMRPDWCRNRCSTISIPPYNKVIPFKPSEVKSAVCLLSGGLDSATCLAFARREGYACYALSFDYGQRHRVELEAAGRVAASIGVEQHLVAKIGLDAFGGWALTDAIPVS